MRRKNVIALFSLLYLTLTAIYFLWVTGWFNNSVLSKGKRWTDSLEQNLITTDKGSKSDANSLRTSQTNSKIGKPIQLVIEKINIDAEIVDVGLVPGTKTIDVPRDGFKAGWYNKNSFPGEKGSSILTAHYDTPTGAPALFYKLTLMQKNDSFFVVDEFGHKIDYVVKEIKNLPINKLPKDVIFEDKGYSQLSLITCSGIWSPLSGQYSNRLIVIATLKKVSTFAGLVSQNKQNEIQIMQPAVNEDRMGSGVTGIYQSIDSKNNTNFYLETVNSGARAVDIYIKTSANFKSDEIEISNVFQSFIINKLPNNIIQIQFFQPQDFSDIDTKGMQLLLVKIKEKPIMLENYPNQSRIYSASDL